MVSNPLRRFALAAAAALLGLSAQAGQIQLAWDPVPGATGYRVYYGTQSGVYTANVTTSATSATVSGLQNCTTYFLAVKAYNEFVSELGGNPQMQTVMASILVLLGAAMLLVQKMVVERGQFQMESGRTPEPVRIKGAHAFIAAGAVVVVVILSGFDNPIPYDWALRHH